MPCTTILVGKKASYDGSTMVARNDDAAFDTKKMIVVEPIKQPRHYKSVISHLEIELPDNPLRYTCCPSVSKVRGVWPAAGINSANVGMSATETTTTNARVLGADPYVEYKKEGKNETPGGIGEEDLVLLVLPYIKSAREGVIRLGLLLEKYGTYESNGIAFNDENEVWWLETIGGHHWIARRVRDEEFVMMPNQFGLDTFDIEDAFGEQKENLCSKDLKEFIAKNHLDLNNDGNFNPRNVFGSRSDHDHIYNTPRAWFIGRYFNPRTYLWDGEDADFTPESDDIPWSMVPERKITIEDVKYVLSSYYQGTKYDAYAKVPTVDTKKYRPIAVSNTDFMALLQIRPYVPNEIKGVEWICFGCNVFNSFLPLYTNTNTIPKYLSNVTLDATTDNFYWCSRYLAALADACFFDNAQNIERYQNSVASQGHNIINEYDEKMIKAKKFDLINEANEKLAAMAKKETQKILNIVLKETSDHMKTRFKRADK